MMDKVQNRVVQDLRRQSRISVQMECRFKSDENEYGALVLDLSQGGALLSSTFLSDQEGFPVQENKISITLDAGSLKAPLALEGTIRRSNVITSGYGKVVKFGVEFEDTPLELIRLIGILSSRRKTPDVSLKMTCQFRSDDKEHEAFLIDLSQGGALLSSTFLPDQKSTILITLKAENMEAPMTLEGTVSRKAATGSNEDDKFGVEFKNPPPELSQLIGALADERNKK